jgi:phosphatidylinositol glycan class N
MYFLGFGACFVILSISVEGIFYTVYSTTLFTWIEVESALRAYSTKSTNTRIYHFQQDDMRIALFFLFFVQVAFFGTGKCVYVYRMYLKLETYCSASALHLYRNGR